MVLFPLDRYEVYIKLDLTRLVYYLSPRVQGGKMEYLLFLVTSHDYASSVFSRPLCFLIV